MNIVLGITGDPWMDWGLAGLAQLAEENPAVFNAEIQPGYLRLAPKNKEDAGKMLVNYLHQQLDRCVMLPREAKLLGYPRKRLANGFYDPDQIWQLSKQELEQAQEAYRVRFAKNRQDTGRDIKIDLNSKPQVSLKRNYPGLKKDWAKLAEGLQEDVDAFFLQWEAPEQGKFYCSLCGRTAPKTFQMRQNKNPFYNQHHNNRIRGHTSNVAVNDMCPTCNVLNIIAAVSADLPYFIEDKTHVIIPQVDDLTTLMEIRKLMHANCLDMDDPNLLSYNTNIRELPRQADLYTSLIGVYWSLKYKYTPNPVSGLEKWDLGLSLERQKQVGRWTVVRYSKGQNVIFAHFSSLKVDSRLFELLEMLRYGKDSEREGDLYRSLLKTLPAGRSRAREQFSQGLVQKSWSLIAQALFRLLKDGEYFATGFAMRFIDYALEVDEVLSGELLEDIKKVATTIGQVFATDIGMMSAINNVHDETSLRKVLKDAFIKMHKIAATNSRLGGDEELWVPGLKRVENILSSVTRENVAAIKDTMLIYATLTAVSRLQQERKKEKQ